MYFTLKGKVEEINKQAGEKKDGSVWTKYAVVLAWNDNRQYDNHAVVNVWGDTFDKMNLKQGEVVEVDCDIDAREYNGRWYNDITAFRRHASKNANDDANDNQFGIPDDIGF